jgi:H+/gluconate symporter-like permease
VTSADDKRVKTALDETRLLILGAQILFGFHLNAAFQRGFGELSALSKDLYVGSFAVMAVTIALLIAPSLQHRLVEQGRASARLLAVTTRFAAMALLLFALGLATDLYVVIAYRFGVATGLVIGPCFGLLAVMLWYGTARLLKRSQMETPPMQEHHTPLDVRIEQMLTEARWRSC